MCELHATIAQVEVHNISQNSEGRFTRCDFSLDCHVRYLEARSARVMENSYMYTISRHGIACGYDCQRFYNMFQKSITLLVSYKLKHDDRWQVVGSVYTKKLVS